MILSLSGYECGKKSKQKLSNWSQIIIWHIIKKKQVKLENNILSQSLVIITRGVELKINRERR